MNDRNKIPSSALDELLDFDSKHIWHPYTSMEDPLPVYPVESADGCLIKLMDGRTLIDGMSSWWAAIHGYNHPHLNEAILKQSAKVSHIMFGGLTHEPAVQLASRLINITPEGLNKIFFSDSGSVAVEVAMKMTVQYWKAKGKDSKNKFITIRSGYHGDTWNAMSVTDPVNGMHDLFAGNLPIHFFADQPRSRFGSDLIPGDIDTLEHIVKVHHHEAGAIILEPIVQGAGGMWFYSEQYLSKVRQICNDHDLLLICDEIATGFGRTGELFASDHAGISPDIMCLGKALSGGYMSFAATLTTDEVATGISNSRPGVFMHGPTFMANPLACAVSLASLELLLKNDWKTNIKRIENQLLLELADCRSLKGVVDIRVIGAIGVIELDHIVDVARVQQHFVEQGVWIRPFRNLIYTMPPYIISKAELSAITQSIYQVIQKIASTNRTAIDDQ